VNPGVGLGLYLLAQALRVQAAALSSQEVRYFDPHLPAERSSFVIVGSLVSSGTAIDLPMSEISAVFPFPRDDNDFDTRCVIVVSRDQKHGWLIDRAENVARSFEGTKAPEWCDEGGL
jgi:hypothetical protein